MCTDFRGVRKRYSLPSTKQVTSTGKMMQSSNGRRWAMSGFITRLYSATVPTVSRYGKKKYVNRAKFTALSVYNFYVNLIH